MDHLHAILHKASRNVRLEPRLKAGFRHTLEVMTEVPAVPAEAAFRLPRSLAFALGAVVLAVSGASATYASARALPGDALYAAKVRGLEPLERAFAFSAEAKADLAVTHLERRFKEATELSAEGTYEAHDAELAELAERDLAAIDAEEHPEARARLKALANAYLPSLDTGSSTATAFARAVIADDESDAEPDHDLAVAVTLRQLARAKASREAVISLDGSTELAARLKESDRLSAAASLALDAGSFDQALSLSGDAAQVAGEAELFASIAAQATTSTSTASSTASTTATSTVQPRDPASPQPASSRSPVLQRIFGN